MAAAQPKSKSDPALVEYRLELVEKAIITLSGKIDKLSYPSKADFDKLDAEFAAFRLEIQTNYVKKSDNASLKKIGLAVATAVAITLATLLLTFVTSGRLTNGN